MFGLIPAYAGRTLADIEMRAGHGAHPRLRGADTGVFTRQLHAVGSSPLTRGGRGMICVASRRLGLIPAYAGRTEPQVGKRLACPAHPRLRGADSLGLICLTQILGSSPLTRGGR